MAIQEIVTGTSPTDPVKGNRGQASQKSTVRGKSKDEHSDRVEVSEEARALFDADQTRRFEAIREKIREGFYFQRDVTEKVVDAILKDLKKTPPAP